jgi:signal transduction histidine kinase
MISFRNFSIPQKIVVISMIISGSALLLATGALTVYDLSAKRRSLVTNATVLARIVAANTAAAVSFNDQAAAINTLESLVAEPSVIASCIYTPDGLFAQRVNPGVEKCPMEPAAKSSNAGQLLVSSPIQLNGREVGVVQVRATLAPAFEYLEVQLFTMGAVLSMAALFAFALSFRLHKVISQPILDLATVAKEISRRKDYSIRAEKRNEDEMGTLVDAFNEMLSQIEKRERALQERTAELVQASRMKDEFLATLSHELRTPLNSILGWSILLQQGRLPPERERSALQAIERNARVQSRLIEDLLDVSRIVSGKFAVKCSEIMLKPIIESAIEVVRPAAEAKHINIQFSTPADLPRVSGDAARLQQVVWNLLSNAVKFTGEHGSILVRLQNTPQHARVSVADNGVGISQEFRPYVFDRFRQADGSSTRAQGGLGLGLAIVRHIVELHGGNIAVDSLGRGYGATFTIDLPLLVPEPTNESFRLGRVR